jgi:hypothetical protein
MTNVNSNNVQEDVTSCRCKTRTALQFYEELKSWTDLPVIIEMKIGNDLVTHSIRLDTFVCTLDGCKLSIQDTCGYMLTIDLEHVHRLWTKLINSKHQMLTIEVDEYVQEINIKLLADMKDAN